jgi:hypothetical protein
LTQKFPDGKFTEYEGNFKDDEKTVVGNYTSTQVEKFDDKGSFELVLQ